MYLYIVHVNIDTSHLICINPDVLEILQTSELNTEIKVKKYIRKERCDQNTINSLIYPNSSSFISVEGWEAPLSRDGHSRRSTSITRNPERWIWGLNLNCPFHQPFPSEPNKLTLKRRLSREIRQRSVDGRPKEPRTRWSAGFHYYQFISIPSLKVSMRQRLQKSSDAEARTVSITIQKLEEKLQGLQGKIAGNIR